MRIIQEEFTNELFKKSFVLLLAQVVKILSYFQTDKGTVVIVKPGIQGVQAVDKASGIGTEISLPIAEFIEIDTRFERAGIDPFRSDLFKGLTDGAHKLVLAGGIGIF